MEHCIFVFKFYTALKAVGYNRDFLQNMANENSRESSGVRNAFGYVDIGRLEGSNPKPTMKFLIEACNYKIMFHCVLEYVNTQTRYYNNNTCISIPLISLHSI